MPHEPNHIQIGRPEGKDSWVTKRREILESDPFKWSTRKGFTTRDKSVSETKLFRPGDYLSSEPFLSSGVPFDVLQQVLSENFPGYTDPVPVRDESKFDERRIPATILDSLVQSFGLP